MISRLKVELNSAILAAVLSIILSVGLGNTSGVGIQAGLICSGILVIVASMVRGTPGLISGPSASLSVVIMALVGTINGDLVILLYTFLMCGLIQVAFGLLNIGKYIRFIPYPVVSGFISGLGVIVIILQLPPALGLQEANVEESINSILSNIYNIDYSSLVFFVFSILIIGISKYYIKQFPVYFAYIAIASLLFNVFNSDMPTMKSVYFDFNFAHYTNLRFPKFDEVRIILNYSFTLASLASIQTLLTSLIADNLSKVRHNSNKELIGQGLGNIASSLLGGMPGAAITTATVANINAGSKSRLSGVLTGIFAISFFVISGNLVGYIPKVVIASVLAYVGYTLIDIKSIRLFFRMPRGDAAVFITVLSLTIYLDIIRAVTIGMLLACVLFMKRVGVIVEELSSQKSLENDVWVRKSKAKIPLKMLGKVQVLNVVGPFFFGFTGRFYRIVEEVKPGQTLVLRMSRCTFMDHTGALALSDSIQRLKERNVDIYFIGLKRQPLRLLLSLGIVGKKVSRDRCFSDMNALLSRMADK